MDGRDVDDAPEVVGVHVGQRRPHQQERRLEHERQDAAEGQRIKVLDGTDVLDPGVVDQDVTVQAQPGKGVDVQEIHRPDRAAQLVRQRRGAGLVHVSQHYLGPPGCELTGARRSDAAGTAGHHRFTAVQVLCTHILLLGVSALTRAAFHGTWAFP
ncbi:MAG: hypothetical protein K0S72_2225 [Arthrobacter sp.]|nr:hypothetical protein [Arthrobacter sp.]